MLFGLMWCFILYFVFFLQVIGPSEGKIYEFMYIFTFLRRILGRICTRKLKTKNGAKNRYQVNFFRKKFGNLLIRPYTFILSVFVLFLLPEKKAKLIVHPLTSICVHLDRLSKIILINFLSVISFSSLSSMWI